MNTRTFPRTSRDAFKGLDYSCSVERPAPTDYPAMWWVCLVLIGIAAVIAALN
jgi:hypothetical protein